MSSADIELTLVGLVAMLEPATLASSVLALVLGDRPLRTGFWFYLGGLGTTPPSVPCSPMLACSWSDEPQVAIT